jgi:hypothetical protein|tara:strand:- start:667 stop:852 length:186 start_codon:yes stop_codon:yes gene_type:complete
MKQVLITAHKIHTSQGKLVRDTIAIMDEAEIEKFMMVRPDAIKVLGDAPVKEAPKAKRKKS